MGVIEGRTWLEILSENDCYELLADRGWGRLGVMIDNHPEIFPVNYALDDQRIVFRVDAGTKLTGLHQAGEVAFEIDDVDPSERRGWSVLIVGRVTELYRPEDMRRVSRPRAPSVGRRVEGALDVGLAPEGHGSPDRPDRLTGSRASDRCGSPSSRHDRTTASS